MNVLQANFNEKFDSSCLENIENEPIIEYRIHLGADLNSRDVNCPMEVDSRYGNTCYKMTKKVKDWTLARLECWSYGGELAFPLPKDQCRVPVNNQEENGVSF